MPRNYNEEVGQRLRLERKRLGFKNQQLMAQALGVPDRSYWEREKGNVLPDADFFARFREKGGDVMYVITGNREHHAVGEKWSPYTPAERAAAAIQDLTLTEEDAQMVIELAQRLAQG